MEKETKDQLYHAGSCFALCMIAAIPVAGPALAAVLWAVTREYYQWKIKAWEETRVSPSFTLIISNLKFFKDDLLYSYLGIAIATVIQSSVYAWKVWG